MMCVQCRAFHCNRLSLSMSAILRYSDTRCIILLGDFLTILNFLWKSAHRLSLCCAIYQRFVALFFFSVFNAIAICNKKDTKVSRCDHVHVCVVSSEYVIDSVRLKWCTTIYTYLYTLKLNVEVDKSLQTVRYSLFICEDYGNSKSH